MYVTWLIINYCLNYLTPVLQIIYEKVIKELIIILVIYTSWLIMFIVLYNDKK